MSTCNHHLCPYFEPSSSHVYSGLLHTVCALTSLIQQIKWLTTSQILESTLPHPSDNNALLRLTSGHCGEILESQSLYSGKFSMLILCAADFLQTLEAFLSEAGISEDAVTLGADDWTIEKILDEKKQFDASLAYEKKEAEGNQGWTSPSPSWAQEPDMPSSSNVLCVRGVSSMNEIVSAHADRKLNNFSGRPGFRIYCTFSNNDSPILSITPLPDDLYLCTSMSGEVSIRRSFDNGTESRVRDHAKYAVAAAVTQTKDSMLIATAGWDQKVFIYQADTTSEDPRPVLTSPIHTISLPTVPEALLFVRHPDTDGLYLILSRRDSTFLYYHSVNQSSNTITVSDSGRQNLAPHSNAWVAFTPSSLAIHPSDPTLLAVATSHLPHMKLILVRLLFPSASERPDTAYPLTQATQARRELEIQNREENAISLHISTLAPQTPYSTPCVAWRPDGSGVWVNGDDGVIRGVEVRTGKVVALLKGHEVGSKVRTLWAGYLRGNEEEREVLISGGFDKRVIIWECQEGDS